MSSPQPFHGIDLIQALDFVRLPLPLGLDDVPEELEALADKLLGLPGEIHAVTCGA